MTLAWLGSLSPRPVVLSAPSPPEECLRRLAAVTTSSSYLSWHLDARNRGNPEPSFRGQVGPRDISVAGFEDASGRSSFAVWLKASAEPAGDAGTTLAGTLGMVLTARIVVAGLAGVEGLIALVAAIALLASGRLGESLLAVPVLLVPAALIVTVRAYCRRVLDRRIPVLIDQVNDVLGSTAVSQAATGNRG
jgi:hypothetical protein